MRYAIIDPNLKEKNIINIIVWEGKEWTPPRNTVVIPCEFANCGDTWDASSGEFTRHYIVAPEEEK